MQFHIETYRDHHLVIKAKGEDVWRGCIIEKRALTRLCATVAEALAEARTMVDEFLSTDSPFDSVPAHISQSDRHVSRSH
jgi:hypothetical protein